jgi:hypothetical protein
MSDFKNTDPAMQAAATDAVAKAEAAATRRRWINLGEFVAVVGLIIAGISLYLTYADRKADQADRQADKTAEAKDKARYEVKTSMRKNDIVINADDRHQLGDVTVTFPTALGLSAQTSSTQTIPVDWYERALRSSAGGNAGTGKLPVLLTVNYFDDDTPMKTTAVFDIVWELGKSTPLFGRELRIVAFKRHESGGSQKRIDSLWAADKPAS